MAQATSIFQCDLDQDRCGLRRGRRSCLPVNPVHTELARTTCGSGTSHCNAARARAALTTAFADRCADAEAAPGPRLCQLHGRGRHGTDDPAFAAGTSQRRSAAAVRAVTGELRARDRETELPLA